LVWGPGDTQLIHGILERAKSGKLRRPGRKDFFIDTTYIDNLIDAQLLALIALDNNPHCCGKVFFITNGQPIRVWDFINSILKSAGLPPVQKYISKNLSLFVAWILEKMHQLFNLKSEPYITRFAIHELCTHHWFNISAAKKLLDYSPKKTIS
jgi:nucleoside-diphosphate-sugar epimerase